MPDATPLLPAADAPDAARQQPTGPPGEHRRKSVVLARLKRTSVLPSFAVLGTFVNDWARNNMEPEVFDFTKKPHPWHMEAQATLCRVLADQYIRQLRGNGNTEKAKKVLYSTTHKEKLFSALQAAEMLLATLTARPSFWDAFNSRVLLFMKGDRYKNDDVLDRMSSCDKDVLELMKVLTLFLFLMHPPYLSITGNATFKLCIPEAQMDVGTLAALKSFEQYGDADARRSVFGIDEAWFRDDMDSSIDLVTFVAYYLKAFQATPYGRQPHLSDPQVFHYHMYEDRILGPFLQLLSSIIASLKAEQDLANTAQAKFLSIVSTAAFMAISLFFHYLQRREAS